ncbi:hypothetical protein J2Y48_001075 [Mycoplana sp. BE70]|uniref:hypothetical protein n=1 Tax=Mycoplana sp. BE70 TaxID=2817775 RepID=UPI0028640735|nr:hypothetical protein [Mycoplana sp. BE70]MDR6755790.1 hypothetical protein [Mycoplana sp. BE70]
MTARCDLVAIDAADTSMTGSGGIVPVDIASAKAVSIASPLATTERLPIVHADDSWGDT